MTSKTLAVVLMCVAMVSAYNSPYNWKGYSDTSNIGGMKATATGYSSAFILTDGEDLRILMKADDTTAAGYKNDSVQFEWGYQLGTITKGTSGVRDTLWSAEDMIVVDTMDADSFGVGQRGTTATNGTITRVWERAADTSDVAGWAIQSRRIVPEWAEIFRFWATGLAGNLTADSVKVNVEVHQRKYVPSGK